MNPLISIIVPNYNHYNYLQQRLESIFNQTYQNFEVILLDDASTDASCQLLESYSKHPKVSHFIINKKNSGSPFKQWEKGLELAIGKYIWIAESDDYSEFTFLENCIKYIMEQPNIGIVYAQSIDVNELGHVLNNRIVFTKEFLPNIWKNNFLIKGKKFIKNYLLEKNVIPNASAVLFKKELVNSAIFTSELLNMKYCGDWFFWIKLSMNTSIGFLAKDLNYFRNHEQVSRNHKNLTQKKQRLLEEKVVRSYLITKNIQNNVINHNLYIKWFELLQFKAIFTSKFYDIKLATTSKTSLLCIYLKYKVVKKYFRK